MKLFFLVLLQTICLSLFTSNSLFSQEKSDSVNNKTRPLAVILNEIQKEYKVNITYQDQLVKDKKSNFSLPTQKTTVGLLLDKLLSPLELQYKKGDGNTYIIVKVEKQITQGAPTTYDSRIITGRVITEDGELPMEKATVMAQSNNSFTSASTNEEGNFSIKVPKLVKVLRFTYVGYDPLEIKVDAKTSDLTVRMVTKNNSMEDVVVNTGVYKRPVENFTGSARTITSEELRRVAPQNILSAISILDPAFHLPEDINVGSDPNHLPDIELRGQNNFPVQQGIGNSSASLKNVYGDKPNAPLFILDGFEVPLQRIFDLDMNRVDRITVLKDASATSIYGSRASNGVVVIDTRQPKTGSVKISYRGGLEISAPDLSSYHLLNASEKLAYEKRIGYYQINPTISGGVDAADQYQKDQEYNSLLREVNRGVNTDWLSKPLQNGYANNHSVYLEGGDEAIRYGINLSSINNIGVMKGSGNKQLSGGITLNYRTKKLLFGNDLSINSLKTTNSPYGSFGDYSKLNPYWSPYDSNGDLAFILKAPLLEVEKDINTAPNPLYNAILPNINSTDKIGFTNNFRIEWSVLDWLRFTGALSYTHANLSTDIYLSPKNSSFSGLPITQRGSYDGSVGKTNSIDGNLGFDIRKNWKKHLLFFTGNMNVASGSQQDLAVSTIGFLNDELADLIFAGSYNPTQLKPSGTHGVSRLISGRVNASYIYDNKYLTDFSISMDKSSQFGANTKAAPFWSVGLGWNIHKEKFMQQAKLISFLKLRGSIGTTGDQNFPPYMGVSTYNYYTDAAYLGQLGTFLPGFGNTSLGWQKSLKTDIGMDATLWNNRISLSGDYYYNITKDLILDITTPPSLGFATYKQNGGSLRNTGWQGNMNVNIIQKTKQQFFWRVGISAAGNKNIIYKISNSLKTANDTSDANYSNTSTDYIATRTQPKTYYKEGESLTTLYVVRSLGIDPANGMEMFLDRNGKRTYVWNPLDKVAIGDTRPRVTGTINTGIDYKGFSFNIYMGYQLGADLYNQTLVNLVENANPKLNVDSRVATERWEKPGDVTFFKGAVAGIYNSYAVVSPTFPSSRFVQKEYLLDASSISFSYQFSDKWKWLKQARLSNTRLELYLAEPFYLSTIKRERGLDYPFAHNITINLSTSIF